MAASEEAALKDTRKAFDTGVLAPSGMDKLLDEVKSLQGQLLEAEAALKRERDRTDLLATELHRLRTNSLSTSEAAVTISAAEDGQEDMVLVPRSTLDMLYLKERAMDAVKEGITIADAQAPDMPLVYINDGFARMTGYPRKTFSLGKNCRFLQGPDTEPEVVRQLSEAVKAGLPIVVQITNYKRSGDVFLNYLSLTPIHDAAGALTHYVGIQADITEMVRTRQAELAAKHAAAEAAAATEAKSQFLARMSHEIRTPLNGMIAVGQLLADTKLTPGQWDLVNTIRCSGEALLTLITDILDFSKIEAGKMVLSNAPFFLQSTIEAAMEIAGLHAARKHLQVAYHMAPGAPKLVIGDAQRLQQVLLNILNNALKFTDTGEVLLEVWTQAIEDTAADCAATSTSAENSPTSSSSSSGMCEIHFSVRDTGIGISAPDLVRLFHSFSQVDASPTRRFGGSGLGLTISQKLSEAMGGRMWAESAGLGHGSTFRWSIQVQRLPEGDPAALAAAVEGRNKDALARLPPAALRDAASAPLLRGKRVLLVEPCEMARQVMLLALRGWGCEVCAVESERAAVAKLALRPGERYPATPSPSGGQSAGGLPRKSRLALRDAGRAELREAQAASATCCGPFDVVILDVGHSSLLYALMECCLPPEAQRVVFLGWPGQRGPEEPTHTAPATTAAAEDTIHDPRSSNGTNPAQNPAATAATTPAAGGAPELGSSSGSGVRGAFPAEAPPPAYSSGMLEGPSTVHAPLAVSAAAASRHLGYVTVSRPVRQGRLRLVLQEVLEMELEAETAGLGSPTSNGKAAAAATAAGMQCREDGAGPLPHAPSIADLPCGPPALDFRSDPGSPSEAGSSGRHSDGLRRSLGSNSSLLHAASVKRVSSNSSLATADGALAASRADNGARRLLLAEDNAINMKVALGILRRLGFTNVVTAPDGVAAVEAVAAAGGPAAFDAILMDLHMPRKGGIEAVQDIRRAWPAQHTKIIAVTADAFEDTRDICVANGFTGWLAKPFRVEEFAQIMGQE